MGIVRVPRKYKVRGCKKRLRPQDIDRDKIDTRRGSKRTKYLKKSAYYKALRAHETKIRTKKQEVRYLTWLLKATGIITKPEICDECRKPHKYIEAHHTNYNDPGAIKWLCRPCHVKEHGWTIDPYADNYDYAENHEAKSTTAEPAANDRGGYTPLRPVDTRPAPDTDANTGTGQERYGVAS